MFNDIQDDLLNWIQKNPFIENEGIERATHKSCGLLSGVSLAETSAFLSAGFSLFRLL